MKDNAIQKGTVISIRLNLIMYTTLVMAMIAAVISFGRIRHALDMALCIVLLSVFNYLLIIKEAVKKYNTNTETGSFTQNHPIETGLLVTQMALLPAEFFLFQVWMLVISYIKF